MKSIFLLLIFLFNFGGRLIYALLTPSIGEDAAGAYFFYGDNLAWCSAIFALFLYAKDAKNMVEKELIRWLGYLVVYAWWKDFTHTNADFDFSGLLLLLVISISLIYRITKYRKRCA